MVGVLYEVGEDGTKGVPLADAPAGFLFRVSVPPLKRGIFAGSVWGVLGGG